jgi:hypothetical protein
LTTAEIAQIGSSLAATVGLFFTAWQFRRSRKAATLQHLQEFLKSTFEREAALANAEDAEKKRHAFVEYLDFLEVYAAAVNEGLFVGVARELVRDKITDSIVALEHAPEWHAVIENSVTSVITYKYLVRFMVKHRSLLDARRASSTVRAANATSSVDGNV